MTAFDSALERLNWVDIGQRLDDEGYAVLPGLLATDAARRLAQQITAAGIGQGALLYFGAQWPAWLAQWRQALYRRLVAVAHRWNDVLGADQRPPAELDAFLQANREAGQVREQSHLSRLCAEDHIALHQRCDGALVFPLQVVAVLSEPGVDFQGGEFVMTEQRPRMQSRPLVVPLQLGDLAVIATGTRPVKGSQGYYRVNLRHGISRVRTGERVGLELSFHNAP